MMISESGCKTSLVVLVVVLLMPAAGWSWGPLGHRVASKIAQSRLSPAAQAAVRDLLGPGVTLSDIADWADEQRDFRESLPWHYVNVPITEPRYNPKYCQPAGCVVSKIEDFRRVLLDPKARRPEKQQALKFLIHFIEDLHQPLHVGDTGSRGGNLIQVRFFGEESNLHKVWDSQIIEEHTRKEQVWSWELTGLATPRMAAEWSKGTPEDWATETLAAAKLAYRTSGGKTLLRSGTRLGKGYCNFALPVVQEQLAKAGVRVAAVLNALFK